MKNDPNRDKDETHSSPHAQTEGSLHSLALSQQKAALVSKPLQQQLCGLASNPSIVDRPNQHPLLLHVARDRHWCAEYVRVRQGMRGHEAGKRWFSHFSVVQLQRMLCTFSSLKDRVKVKVCFWVVFFLKNIVPFCI